MNIITGTEEYIIGEKENQRKMVEHEVFKTERQHEERRKAMNRTEGIEEIRTIMKGTGLGVLTPVNFLWEEIKAVVVDVDEEEYLEAGLSE